MKNEEITIIKFVVGDWSKDGHNISEDYIIKVNCTINDIKKAYKKSVEKFNINPIENICSDYSDNTMNYQTINIFKNVGYIFEDNNEYYTEYGYIFDPDKWVDFILWFIKQSKPDLIYTIISESIPTLSIGGYGFFGD